MRIGGARCARVLTVALIWAACRSPDTRTGEPTLTLTPRGLGSVRLCGPLDSVGPLLGSAAASAVRDTVFTGEGDVTWPGRVVELRDGGLAEFESSWIDSTRIWRIGTVSRAVSTSSGLRVDDAVHSRPAASPLRADLVEGQLVLELRGDTVAALVDTTSEGAISKRPDYELDPMAALPPGATVRKLIVSGDCSRPTPAS